MILNQSQAEAVYRAMCELNNVGAKIKATLDMVAYGQFVKVWQHDANEFVTVIKVEKYHVTSREVYASQAEFAAAYGLE